VILKIKTIQDSTSLEY